MCGWWIGMGRDGKQGDQHSAKQVKMGKGSQTTATGIEGIEEDKGGVQSLKAGSSDQLIMYRYMCDYNGQSN